jgi:hypothetical protein
MKTRLLLSMLVLSGGLSACFGGSDDAPVTPMPPVAETEVPASASASPEAYSLYAGSVAPSETAEPLGVDAVVPPVSETAEPIDVT